MVLKVENYVATQIFSPNLFKIKHCSLLVTTMTTQGATHAHEKVSNLSIQGLQLVDKGLQFVDQGLQLVDQGLQLVFNLSSSKHI
jgi:hypothetical protein